jgi:hypothetical protein
MKMLSVEVTFIAIHTTALLIFKKQPCSASVLNLPRESEDQAWISGLGRSGSLLCSDPPVGALLPQGPWPPCTACLSHPLGCCYPPYSSTV